MSIILIYLVSSILIVTNYFKPSILLNKTIGATTSTKVPTTTITRTTSSMTTTPITTSSITTTTQSLGPGPGPTSTITTTTSIVNNCLNECRRQGYLNGTCRSYVVDPDALVCDSNEVNIGQIEDCKIESGLMGVGKTCCCGTDRIITQLTVAQDGSGNFTDIQSAIDYAYNLWGGTQKTIKIKSGTYVINRYPNMKPYAGLVLPSNTVLQGEPDVVIKEIKDGWMERLITNEHSCVKDGLGNCTYQKTDYKDSNIVIKDLTIDGNRVNQSLPYNTGRNCVWFLNIKDVTIDNITFQNCAGSGITTTWASNVKTTNSNFLNNWGNGVYFDRTEDCALENNYLFGSNASNVDVYFAKRISIKNNIILNSTNGWGIDCDSVQFSNISNNVIGYNGRAGIVMWADGGPNRRDHPEGGQRTYNNIISNNEVFNNDQLEEKPIENDYDGIDLSHNNAYGNYADHNIIENNKIYDNQTIHTQRYTVGIGYPTDDYNVIRNNYYWGNINNSVGIVWFFRGAADHTVIENNFNHPP